ncbi:hypothetical protein [Helicobacter burdigaliensis]|uniref:hypothetical protein n=1 Tax=Helicobacter burdigaliensis TaxID=2315334 RepID=UPI001E5A8F1B|nr:hypothetical protein [Helicobacter burdigaliensis]
MKVYLVNKNPIIAKLVALSASKAHLELIQSENIEVEKEAGIILIDDESYDEELFLAYKQAHGDIKSAFFYSKSGERVEGFSEYIQKPFLPTDLFNTLNSFTGGFEFAKENLVDVKGEEYEDIVEVKDTQATKENDTFTQSDFIAEESTKDLLEDLDLESNKEENLEGFASEDFGANIEEHSIEDKNELELADLGFTEEKDSKESEGVLDLDEINNLKELLEDKPIQEEAKEENHKEENLEDFGFEESAPKDENEKLEGFEEATIDTQDKTQEKEENLEDLLEGLGKLQEDSKEQEPQELEKTEETKEELAEVSCEESGIEDLEGLSLEEDMQPKEEATKEDLGDLEEFNLDILDNLPNDLEEQENKDANKEESIEQSENNIDNALDNFELEDTPSEDEEAKVSEGDTKEVETSLDNALDEEFKEDLGANTQEEVKEVKEASKDLEDEFGSLSLEGMSEALGEPIAKEPNVAPIVPQNEEKKINGDLQVNSIETLMMALQSLQTQGIKEILSGATINISIQFPKKEQE